MTAKDLKNALLQEAVQGKLVPQIASEGNARDLLEEIRKARGESLPLATARKRSSATPSAGTPRNAPMEITEDEIPFDIPESWCWCRLGELVDFGKCQNAEPSEISDDAWILDLEDIEKDTGKIIQIKKKSEVDCKSTKHIFKAGYVLYSKLRPYLNKCVIATKDGFCTSEILPLNFGTHVYNRYAQTFLMSPFFVDYTNSLSFGVKMPRLGTEDGKKAVFPLPPLAEQKRIVAAIEKFMPLIEEYGKKETVLNELNAQIGTLTKKAILQEAVQGKLVPQIPAEGNAKDLLEQIKAQKATLIKERKIKKEKPLPEITEDEIPFDIPENWCWCRLGEIFHVWSARRVHQSDWKSEGIPFYRAREIGKLADEGFVDNDLFITEELYSEYSKTGIPEEDDLMITAVGTLGKIYIVKKDDRFYYKDASVISFKNFGKINSLFAKYVLDSNFMHDTIKNASSGTTVGTITIQNANMFPFPLPPLSEQKRIVEAIEKMLPICEKFGK